MAEAPWEDWQWLVSEDGAKCLRDAASINEPAKRIGPLRRQLNATRTALVLEQLELRVAGARKFTRAAEMFFTRRGLEQSTDERTARYKALRFPGGPLVDACCGIGGDLIALAAKAARSRAIDRDPISLLLAAANARVYGVQDIEYQICDVRELQELAGAWLHIDPDRRSGGQRVSQVDYYDPDPDTIAALMDRARGGGVKLAPAAEVPAAWSASNEREWIEIAGECRQQVLWFGEAARHGGIRIATRLDRKGNCLQSFAGTGASRAGLAAETFAYVYDPAPCLLAARLLDDLAASLHLERVAAQNAYLCSDELVQHGLLAAFQVQAILPFDMKRLKRYLREHALGHLEIKKRGVDLQPERLMKELANPGGQHATLLVMRHQQKVVAVVAQRCPTPVSPDH